MNQNQNQNQNQNNQHNQHNPNYPPNGNFTPNRRQQQEHPYYYPPQQPQYQHYPPQPMPYHFQQYQPHPYAPQYPQQQWYPQQYQYQQPYSPSARQFQPQYPQYPPQQHHGPVIVSSHHQPPPPPPQPQSFASPSQAPAAPPSLPQSQATPLVAYSNTPQPLPSTPSIASQTQEDSPATPTTSISTYTPSPSMGSRPPISSTPSPSSVQRSPYPPQLPWLSNPDESFPSRVRRRRKVKTSHTSIANLQLPDRDGSNVATPSNEEADNQSAQGSLVHEASSLTAPATPRAPAAVTQTQPTEAKTSPSPAATTKTTPRAPIPIPKPTTALAVTQDQSTKAEAEPAVEAGAFDAKVDTNGVEHTEDAAAVTEPAPAVRAPLKSWADLMRKNGPPAGSAAAVANGATAVNSADGRKKAASLAEAVRGFKVADATRVAFLEPRGLVNTGNMCYMNSVLQVLVFCAPFYDFLDQVGKQAAHSFKSDTPLIDAMIMFMREFKVIDAASSVDQLRLRLKDTELEQYGDSFIPEFAYDVIKRLPRFSSMKRGHQQDAEEFLGFLLEGLHDECAQLLRSLPPSSTDNSEATSPMSERSALVDNGWLEVGHKQRTAMTQSSGHVNLDSPITKIFGGQLRSELRVPGKKPSITHEPYQPLQLDISAPGVNNIVDALKGLTKSETLHGDFNSPRGPGTTATKQVTIETLPPVLILHLKRFHYDNMGGAQKIWKKVGYPLDLTIPKEVFATHKRAGFQMSGLPQYRLSSVVYHHGKNANGGHYTVDVRRQDGREWIRLDDTLIRRVRSEDVAEGGAEEDPKILAKALEQHKNDSASASKNIYDSINGVDEDAVSENGGWSQVAAKEKESPAVKKWSAVANGTAKASGKSTPKHENIKDNKVAYLLFYRRVS